jgi:peroxiredoxin
VELERLRGRPLVLNFWASWCPPCVRELGSFEELKAAVEARGIEATFLFVSPESPRIAAEFIEDNGWNLPFAVERRRAPASLGDLVLPTTFIVDRRGAVALRHRGATDWNQPEVVELLASLDRRAP